MYAGIDEKTQDIPRRLVRHPYGRLSAAILLMFLSTSSTSADEIFFTSGYSKTGVVVRETDYNIRFRTEMGMSTISKEKISFIEKAAPEENQLLLKQWRGEREKRKAEAEALEEAERKFEQEQIAKGLLKFEGKWISPAEKETLLDTRERAAEHRRTFEDEQHANGLVQFEHIWVTPELSEELKEMETEIYRLYDEISEVEDTVDSLRSAMLNVSSLEEAEEFSQRIEKTSETMDKKTGQLNKLLKKADDIEATSITYEIPKEFLDALPPDEEGEEDEEETEPE